MEEPAKIGGLVFLKGGENALAARTAITDNWASIAGLVRDQISEAMNARNVSFLFGAGTSSYVSASKQVGISTMQPLAKEFVTTVGREGDETYVSQKEREILEKSLGVKLTETGFLENLELLMEVLHSNRFALSHSNLPSSKAILAQVESVIGKVQKFLLKKCTIGAFSEGDDTVVALYQSFYRKLILRDRALPRPWIFTTNYDLFNELAMDRLGLPYCNGFSGTIERRFNPAVFRYALAEQLDISSRKWSAVDGFVYLTKLHGSVSWWEDGYGLFPIRETQLPNENSSLMIYPTPAKQNSSLGSPYSDLFREFQSQITRSQSVLVTIGYRFGDEHLNNLIYQALTIPTFRLVIVADPESGGEIAKLRRLEDPRIWILGGHTPDGASAHYFNVFVDEFMPALPGDRIDRAVKKIIDEMIRHKDDTSNSGDTNDAG